MTAPERRPDWLRKKTLITGEVAENKARIAGPGLRTICESGRCPNLSDCFRAGNATYLIMGDTCTRDCSFCAVPHGEGSALDPKEGCAIARAMAAMSMRYAVITSVTRDDLPDGGAAHFANVVRDIRAALPAMSIELLVPDFQGMRGAVESVAALPIEVFGHNLETVQTLYPAVRRGGDYKRSLDVLRWSRANGTVMIKSGIMVGLGESSDELARLFDDLAAAGVGILTIGQYLRPARRNIPVARYFRPEELETLAQSARERGIPVVHAGPYVRSSYLAESLYRPGLRPSSATPWRRNTATPQHRNERQGAGGERAGERATSGRERAGSGRAQEKDLTRGIPGNIISDETDT
jgi:lipoic acid synthetase